MPRRSLILLALAMIALLGTAYALQYPGRRMFTHGDDDDEVTPPDANEKTEWAFAKLRYPTHHSYGGGYRGRRQFWLTDSPAAERHFAKGVRRLTRIHARSEKQVIDLDNDDVYNWPWLYAVEVGHWELPPAQCKKLRDYLDRGGFLMVDDFHGTREWSVFIETMSRIFPDRPIIELPNDDPIYHVIYDTGQRVQIPGTAALSRGVTYEYDGYEPKWRGIRDDKGRVVVAICHNMDLGDAWEWADSPEYPEQYTSMAYRIGVNYLVYSMTH